jgi:hypothetical protein
MNFGCNDSNRGGDNQRPRGYLVRYTVGPKINEATTATPLVATVDAEDLRTKDEKLHDAIRDLKIDHLKKRTDGKEKETETKGTTSKDNENENEKPVSTRNEEGSDKEKEDKPDTSSTFDEMYTQLIGEYPNHVPLLMARLQYLDSHSKRDAKLPEIIEAAKLVLDCISEDDIALTLGKNGDDQDPKYIKVQNEKVCLVFPY